MSEKLERLREALGLLAAPADRQIEILAEMGHFEGREIDASGIDAQWNVDEIGLQFGDAEIFLPELLEKQEINVAQLECISILKVKLSQCSGIENMLFWTLIGIKTDPEWENIRGLARECLMGLDDSGQSPIS